MKQEITEELITTTMQLTKLYHEEYDFQRIPLDAEDHLMNLIRFPLPAIF